MLDNITLFAATYDCGAYGSGSYDNATCGTSTTGTTGNTGSGVLTNTGFDLLMVVTLACFITFIALVVRFWKRPNKLST